VGDGRDLGTVVFPLAEVKIFLDASCEERAQRRYKQLIDQGISANFDHLFDSIRARDERDRTRSTAPLVAAKDAWVIDSTHMTIEAVVENSAAYVRERLSIV
jgi:cytidylate kinase